MNYGCLRSESGDSFSQYVIAENFIRFIERSANQRQLRSEVLVEGWAN